MNRLLIFVATLSVAYATLQVKVGHEMSGVQPMPENYIGFSIEVGSTLKMIALPTFAPKLSFSNLVQRLGKAVSIRVGGNSAEFSYYNADKSAPKPANITYTITDSDLEAYAAFSRRSNAKFTLDLNFLRGHNASWAVDHALAVRRVVGWDSGVVSAVEIGNECDIFYEKGIRAPSYRYPDYDREFASYLSALRSTGELPAKRVQGATFCCNRFDFNTGLSGYVEKYSDELSTLSYHRYPLSHCNGNIPTLAELLSDKSAAGQAQQMRTLSADTWRGESPVLFVVGESNSVSCGGYAGVSDVMGTALWAVDYLFNLATINTTLVNFHGGPTGTYPAVAYNDTHSEVQTPDVRPLYYALWLVTEVIGDGARLLSVSVSNNTLNVRVWSVMSGDTVRVVVVNKESVHDTQVEVATPEGVRVGDTGSVLVLEASSISAKYGLHYAGQTFDGSVDGDPVGERKVDQVVRSEEGKFVVAVKAATVAVLVLHKE